MKKLGLLGLFIVGVLLISFTTPLNFKALLFPLKGSPAERITTLWNKDLAYIKTVKGFPKPEEIQDVNFIPGNRLAKFWLYKSNPNLNFSNPNGKYILEITLMGWAQSVERALVIQYELFDAKTHSKSWEFARTLVF